ncbi:MAG TPA: 23S rRNA (adenine(2030)-N(6))-methyltransferase RlmJ [Hyphomicrobium sp.]|nr:23S rRNA (adenine(2030)-N(6))-methyltransferase RlmJ [Hyphomicrobium sp.]
MNYRHAYHAGNFADVVKHAVLTLIIEHMKQKPAPFRVVDTHAGIGLYDLTAEQAQKTGEWREGIGRLMRADLSAAASAALAPYLDSVRALNPEGMLLRYPGSPLIARDRLRADDRLVLNELHPEDQAELARLFARDRQVKAMALDAWTAVKALLPPPERRGLTLIDPAFEVQGELDRLVEALQQGVRRFATGTFLLWYPIKEMRPVAAFRQKLAALGLPKVLAIEFMIRGPEDETRLNGAGLIAVNAPYTLAETLRMLLPELVKILAQGKGAGFRLEELGHEAAGVRQK